jgi:hypothetical protein
VSLKRRVAKIEAVRQPKVVPSVKVLLWHPGEPEPKVPEGVTAIVVKFV